MKIRVTDVKAVSEVLPSAEVLDLTRPSQLKSVKNMTLQLPKQAGVATVLLRSRVLSSLSQERKEANKSR